MPESIKVEGLKELTAGIKKLDGEMLKELKRVSKASAEIVAEEARSIVPVRSGRLQKKIKSLGTMKGGLVKVGGLDYHKVQHFGWRKHNIAPHPFLYEALDSRRNEVLEKFEREVDELIDKAIPGVKT